MRPVFPPAAGGLLPKTAPELIHSGDGAALEWSFNPWCDHPANALLGAFAFVGIIVLLALLRLPLLVTGVLLAVSTSEFPLVLLPARCRVDEEGVARRLIFFWESRPWDRIRRASLGRRGLFVSPQLRPGLLASFRGMLLPVPPTAAPALLSELRQRLAQHGL